MCGILGEVWPCGGAVDTLQVNDAIKALRLRGPDDVGIEWIECAASVVALGHTRLSIIDLSALGHQPMHSCDGRYRIVFNGEIYNYRELRQQLKGLGCAFHTDSDTEVLIAAWATWGASCLPRLVGMFAFAILDREAGSLTCVRDAFGIKPFFYAFEGGNFLFASEIPAVLALKAHKAEVNWQRAYDYLVHGAYDSTAETFFEGILSIPPGHILRVDLHGAPPGVPERWWSPCIVERRDLDFAEAAERVRELFLDSVRLHLRSDVPLGAALSGGVDSSAIVCAMRHLEPDMPISTFSFIAKGSDVSEERWVDAVNRQVGAVAHKVSIAPNELMRDINTLIRAQGEPFGSMSIYAQYRVYELAKQHGVTVTLDGQGADEMLGGYIGFPGERVRGFFDTHSPIEALAFLDRWSRWPGRSLGMGLRAALAEMTGGAAHELIRWMAGLNKTPDWIDGRVAREMGIVRRIERFKSDSDARGRRMPAQMVNMLTRHGLPALLRHGDRNSMRFSVESRVPFLSLELVELMLSLPEDYLVSRNGETKHVFRKAMQGIVPDEVLFRKDKIGFEPPEKEWFLAIANQARDWLRDDAGIPFVRGTALLAHFDEIATGRKAFSWQAWRWINFYRWKAVLAV